MFGRFIWGLNMLKETLDTQKAKELGLQKEKQTLILSISHDIKTPLSAIKLYSKALSERLYDDETKIIEAAKKIDQKADEIQHSIDAIIKTSTEDFIDFHVNNGEFYINDLTNKITAYYSDKLSSIRTSFSIEKVKNCLIRGDLDRMCEVAENFMENAIKYGDGKEITITFMTEEDCLLMTVSNSGCTLNPDEISHVFDCFRRGTNSGNISGSGLGLYIARNLMTRMGGEAFAQVTDGYFNVTAVMKKA
jgi:signal transduction histidine kinase